MIKPVVKVNLEALKKLQKKMPDADFANKINVSPATLSRIKNEKAYPGESFIAGVLGAFPKKKFDQIFFLDDDLRERK